MEHITFNLLWGFIIRNKSKLESLGILIDKEDISYGDEYYNEEGEVYILNIDDQIFKIGYNFVTEDNDEWAQAECYKLEICEDEDNGHIDHEIVYKYLTNTEFLRDVQLEKLGIKN